MKKQPFWLEVIVMPFTYTLIILKILVFISIAVIATINTILEKFGNNLTT